MTEATSEQEFLDGALGGFSCPSGNSPGHGNPVYNPKGNYHTSWVSYVFSISLTILVLVGLYYLNTDTATEEYQMRYRILTGLILLLAVGHVLIAAY